MRCFVVILAVAAGCAPPGSTLTDVEGVHLRALRVEDSFYVEVVNDSSEAIVLGCADESCDDTLRFEALQESGDWQIVGVGSPWAGEPRRRLSPQTSAELARSHGPFDGPIRGPGTYRAVVRFETASGERHDVAMELSSVGWPASMAREAEPLRVRAAGAHCAVLAWEMQDELIQNLEPDPLIDMHRAASDDERDRIVLEMIDRGGFRDYLTQRLAIASLDEVTFIAGSLVRLWAPTQDGLRRSVVSRLFEELDEPGAIEDELFYDIERLSDVWPAYGVDRLLARLLDGPERGASLASLIDVFTYAGFDALNELRTEVAAAIDERCSGAEVVSLLESCGRARRRFGPDGELTFFGRGVSGLGWGCGGAGHSVSATCSTIAAEWGVLRDHAGPAELVFH